MLIRNLISWCWLALLATKSRVLYSPIWRTITFHSATRKFGPAPLDVCFHFSKECDSRFPDNNSITLEEPFMRIIGILTYRAAENRYVPSDKGRCRYEWPLKNGDSIYRQDQTRLSRLPVDTWNLMDTWPGAVPAASICTLFAVQLVLSKYNGERSPAN